MPKKGLNWLTELRVFDVFTINKLDARNFPPPNTNNLGANSKEKKQFLPNMGTPATLN